jgi:hypothetical protein
MLGINQSLLNRGNVVVLGVLLLVLGCSVLQGQGSPPTPSYAGLRLVHAAGTTNRVQFLMNGRNISRDGLLPGYAGGVGGFPAGKSMFTAKSGEIPASPPLPVELTSGLNVAVVAFLETIPQKDRQPGKPDKKLAVFAIPQEPTPEGKSRFRLLMLGEPSCEILCNDQKISLETGKIQEVGGSARSIILRDGAKLITECQPVKPGDHVIIVYRDASGAWAATQYEDRVTKF